MELAGLAVSAWALPEATMNIAKLAKEIANRIHAYREASNILRNLYEVGYLYHDSMLKKNVELAVALVTQTGDERLKQAAGIQTRQLYRELEKAREVIDRLIDADGKLNKWRFAFEGERALKKIIKNLVGYQHEFTNFITIAESTVRSLPQSQNYHLSRTTLRYLSGSWEEGIIQANRPNIRLCAAEWKPSDSDDVQEISVLIEEQLVGVDDQREEIEKNVQDLARLLSLDFQSGGFLQCLGYRTSPHLDLVFQVPDYLVSPQSLKESIWKAQSSAPLSLNHRLRVARMLAQAVLSVHAAGLVHKNIRPETILLFQDKRQRQSGRSASDLQAGETNGTIPILTEWRMLRKLNDTSSRRGEDNWDKNIYRHPERQGLRPETRYNMGHDIYSLGVCLLEIGLWQSLIVRQALDQQAKMTNSALDLSIEFRQAANEVEPILADKDDALRLLTKPVLVREALLHLVANRLPSSMGDGYAKVVKDCLTCLDHTEQREEFKGDRVGAEIAFNRMVLQPLFDIVI